MTESEIRARMSQSRDAGTAALMETYYAYVYAIVWQTVRRFGSREDAEECVQDVFHDVTANFAAVHEGALKAYLGRAAHNRALTTCRALTAKSRQTVSIDENHFGELPDRENISERTEQNALTEQVLDCIESLGQPDAALILQRYYYERNAAESGRALGMNPVTVRSRLHRAMKRLRRLLDERGISL